jgi:hypothetical protein
MPSIDFSSTSASAGCAPDNPQVQGIDVTPLNVEVLGIEPQEQEGKAIYCLKLECHNLSYLCTAQKQGNK